MGNLTKMENSETKGLEKRLNQDKLESLKQKVADNIKRLKWITKAEVKGNQIVYNIKKGKEALNGCLKTKTHFDAIVLRDFENREDVYVELEWGTVNPQRGTYSIGLNLISDNPQAQYEVIEKLNKGLEIYLTQQ